MTSPADRLLAAADLLDKLANNDLTPGPWTVEYECPEGEHHHDWDEVWIAGRARSTVAGLNERYTAAPRDARYIAAMHPEVGKQVAASLREAAYTIERNALLVAQGRPTVDIASASLLDLADLLLAGEPQ